MKKLSRKILKRNVNQKAKISRSNCINIREQNPLVENTRKLLSGDIQFFNKLKEKNMRRRLSIVTA